MTIRPSLREVTTPPSPPHAPHAQLVPTQRRRRDPQRGRVPQSPRRARLRFQLQRLGQRGPDPLGVRQVEAQELTRLVGIHTRYPNAH